MAQSLNNLRSTPHTKSRNQNFVVLGGATLLFSLLACHTKEPGSPESSDLKTDPAGTPTSPPFREDFVPTMDWICKDGSSTPLYEVSLKWKGRTDDKGWPVNAYDMVFQTKDPNQGPKTVTTTVTLQTQFAPNSTWPSGIDGPFIRSFRFVGKIKSEDNKTTFDFKEVIYNDEPSKDHASIARTRFAIFRLQMSSFLLPVPGAGPHDRLIVGCTLSQIHLRVGEPISLVHANVYGKPKIENGKLLKLSDSQVDHMFSDGTIGSLGLGVQELNTAFKKHYIESPYDTAKEIAVVSKLGIHIGNVVKIPSRTASASPPSGLQISNNLWQMGFTKETSLILWDGTGVNRPNGYPKIKYRIYGPNDFISLDFKKLIIDLCQNRASPAVTCSKNEVDALLKNTDKAVAQIPRSIPRCSP